MGCLSPFACRPRSSRSRTLSAIVPISRWSGLTHSGVSHRCRTTYPSAQRPFFHSHARRWERRILPRTLNPPYAARSFRWTPNHRKHPVFGSGTQFASNRSRVLRSIILRVPPPHAEFEKALILGDTDHVALALVEHEPLPDLRDPLEVRGAHMKQGVLVDYPVLGRLGVAVPFHDAGHRSNAVDFDGVGELFDVQERREIGGGLLAEGHVLRLDLRGQEVVLDGHRQRPRAELEVADRRILADPAARKRARDGQRGHPVVS